MSTMAFAQYIHTENLIALSLALNQVIKMYIETSWSYGTTLAYHSSGHLVVGYFVINGDISLHSEGIKWLLKMAG